MCANGGGSPCLRHLVVLSLSFICNWLKLRQNLYLDIYSFILLCRDGKTNSALRPILLLSLIEKQTCRAFFRWIWYNYFAFSATNLYWFHDLIGSYVPSWVVIFSKIYEWLDSDFHWFSGYGVELTMIMLWWGCEFDCGTDLCVVFMSKIFYFTWLQFTQE